MYVARLYILCDQQEHQPTSQLVRDTANVMQVSSHGEENLVLRSTQRNSVSHM